MDGGYYEKVIEYAPSVQTMSVSIGDASSMNISATRTVDGTGLTVTVLPQRFYTASELQQLNLDLSEVNKK